jgi:nitrite reductase (NADH) small subunit/3-phenylpropionate/trans-cinnamate dioxygenase ferredoxin subunit
MAWTSLCSLDELTEGNGKYVEVDGYKLAVFLHEGRPHVMDNYCPHAGGSMAGGYIEDGCAVCPWHNWPFRLGTGELKGSPAVTIDVYPTRLLERDGESPIVQADLPVP